MKQWNKLDAATKAQYGGNFENFIKKNRVAQKAKGGVIGQPRRLPRKKKPKKAPTIPFYPTVKKVQRVLAGFPAAGPDARKDTKHQRNGKAKGGLIKSSRKKSIDGIARRGHTRAPHK